MISPNSSQNHNAPAGRQQGLVLFFALIALVAISLAAVALIRSVDTNTIISGNLAFRQSATTSADAGAGAAIDAMAAIQTANLTADPYSDAGHPFNSDSPATGYYSNVDPALDLTSESTWTNEKSALVGTDSSGNTIRYIVQRMCRTKNQVLSKQNCLFSGSPEENGEFGVKGGEGGGAPPASELPPQYRITARVTGPKNTYSYVQTTVY